MNRTGVLVTLALAAIVGGLIFYAARTKPVAPTTGPPTAGRQAPDATSQTLDGKPWRLADQRDKVVLLDFWATWCPGCVAAMPDMKKLHEHFKDRPDFLMVGVSLDDTQAMVNAFLKERPLPWLQLHENNNAGLAGAFGISMLPTVILIDRDGTIIGVDLPHDELKKAIEQRLRPIGG